MKVNQKLKKAYELRNILILISLSISMLIITFSTTALVNALPVMQSQFGIQPSNLQWLLNSYILTSIIFMLLAGKLYDTYDNRTIYVFALVGYILSSLIIIYSPNSLFLYAGRAIQGIGAAFIASGALIIIKKTFPKYRLQKAIAIWSTIAGSGFCAGPFIGGFLTTLFSWTYIFWMAILFIVISMLIILLAMPKAKQQNKNEVDITRKGSFDIAGNIIISLGLLCVVFALVKVNALGWSDPLILITLFFGITSLVFFYFVEKKTVDSLVDFTIFRNREFSLSLLGTLALLAIVLMEIPYLFNFYAQNETILNLSAYHAGCALLPINIFYILGTFLSTKTVKYLDYYYTILIAIILQVLGLLMLSYFAYYVSYYYFVIPFCLIGFGGGITFPCYSLLAINNIANKKVGQASSLLNIATFFGDLSGTAIWSLVFFYSGSRFLLNSPNGIKFYNDTIQSNINRLIIGNKKSLGEIIDMNVEYKSIIVKQVQEAGVNAFSSAMFYSAVAMAIIAIVFALYLREKKC